LSGILANKGLNGATAQRLKGKNGEINSTKYKYDTIHALCAIAPLCPCAVHLKNKPKY
jgi:hypothetical protein